MRPGSSSYHIQYLRLLNSLQCSVTLKYASDVSEKPTASNMSVVTFCNNGISFRRFGETYCFHHQCCNLL
jgi:hypothetical protein